MREIYMKKLFAFTLLALAVGCRLSAQAPAPSPITVSVINAAELDITGCVTSRYSDYEIRFRLFPETDGANVLAQVGSGSYDTAGDYISNGTLRELSGRARLPLGLPVTGFNVASAVRANRMYPVAGAIELLGASVSGIEHSGRGWVTASMSGSPSEQPTAVYALSWNYLWIGTVAIDRLRFVASNGNITGTATCLPLRQ
jgi:hypothetical protein